MIFGYWANSALFQPNKEKIDLKIREFLKDKQNKDKRIWILKIWQTALIPNRF
jgi:hypothetical protein